MKLTELLGAELAAKVQEALKGKAEGGKDIEIGIINDGSYIAADKYNELKEKHKAADQLAKDAAKQLEGLKDAGDPAKLKADLEAAQQKVKDDAAAHAKAMADKDRDYAVRAALTDAHDPALVASMLDAEKLEVLQDGTVKGLDDQLKGLREEKTFLFRAAEQETKTMGGFVPAATAEKTDTGAQTGPTIF